MLLSLLFVLLSFGGCSDEPAVKPDVLPDQEEVEELLDLDQLEEADDESEQSELTELVDVEDETEPQCLSNDDCLSGVCDTEQGLCLEPTCEDGVANGEETDLDCGGPCLPCADGAGCRDDSDCVSGSCDNESLQCLAAACDDGVLNGLESDVDCGAACVPCVNGKRCGAEADCQSGLCLNGFCQVEHCSSGALDGDESDVDCGGSCAACEPGASCGSALDCESQVCVEGACAAASCEDGVLNGDEVDVDCAGSCAACPDGSRCVSDADCANGSCYLDRCQPESCSNGVLDTGETDVDCGGACEPCALNQACVIDADCTSGLCVELLCRGETLVRLDPQGGSTPNPASVLVRYGQAYGEFPETSRSGFGFAGWWTEPGEAGELVTPETVVSRLEEHTLYAHWSAATVTVSFVADGGSEPDPATKQVVVNAPYGPLATTTREGYTFEGWWTQPGGVGELVTSSSIVLIPTDHTLYPRWSVNAYTVSFDVQGGTAANPASKVVDYGSVYGTLPTTSRVGYLFDGWWTGPNGTGTEVLASSVMLQQSDHTLYASWIANTYTVVFDVQGGVSSDPTNRVVTFGSVYGTLPAVSRVGYSFSGWWTQPGGVGTQINASTVVSIASDHTLYANWVAETYTVSFDAQGGSAPSPGSKAVTFGSPYGALASTTRPGFIFEGWWTAETGGSLVEPSTMVSIASDHNLYARWTASTLTVSFDAQGGSTPNPATKSVTYNAPYGTLPSTSRAGYSFGGWYTEASGGTQVLATTTVTVSTDHTLYARWTANTYTVTFDPQFGSAPSPATKTVTFGGTYGTLPTTVRAGYTFLGWWTAISGGSQIQSSTVVGTASNHTLYARWSAQSFLVTFDAQGGSAPNPATKSVTFGSTYGSLASTSRTGFVFAGWWTSPSGGVEVFSTSPVTIPNNHTLYARWSGVSFVNASFESGFNGWTIVQNDPPSSTWAILPNGYTVALNDLLFDEVEGVDKEQYSEGLPWTNVVTQGSSSAMLLVNGPDLHRIYQDVLIPSTATTLSWDMQYQSHASFDPSMQYIALNLRNPATDSIIATPFKTENGLHPEMAPMQTYGVNVTAYRNQLIRVELEIQIQHYFLDVNFDNFRF